MPFSSDVATRAKHTGWKLASRNVEGIDCIVLLEAIKRTTLTELLALGRVGDHLDFLNSLF